METIELKAFVPAKDFELSKRFYQGLGFLLASSDSDIADLHHGNCSFLLQRFYVKEHADNLMIHLPVKSVDAWRTHIQKQDIVRKFGVRATPPGRRPWGMRDFVITDPAGVLWRIAESIDAD